MDQRSCRIDNCLLIEVSSDLSLINEAILCQGTWICLLCIWSVYFLHIYLDYTKRSFMVRLWSWVPWNPVILRPTRCFLCTSSVLNDDKWSNIRRVAKLVPIHQAPYLHHHAPRLLSTKVFPRWTTLIRSYFRETFGKFCLSWHSPCQPSGITSRHHFLSCIFSRPIPIYWE